MNIRAIKEVCLYVTDLTRTRDFYTKVLGFSVISEVNNRHVFFKVGEQVLLCFNPDVTRDEEVLPPHYAFGKQHIAFEVDQDDYPSWKEKLQKAGIIITYEQHWRGKLYSCYFDDPDGHVLEIVPSGLWEAN